jgi:hypothetical protein
MNSRPVPGLLDSLRQGAGHVDLWCEWPRGTYEKLKPLLSPEYNTLFSATTLRVSLWAAVPIDWSLGRPEIGSDPEETGSDQSMLASQYLWEPGARGGEAGDDEGAARGVCGDDGAVHVRQATSCIANKPAGTWSSFAVLGPKAASPLVVNTGPLKPWWRSWRTSANTSTLTPASSALGLRYVCSSMSLKIFQ